MHSRSTGTTVGAAVGGLGQGKDLEEMLPHSLQGIDRLGVHQGLVVVCYSHGSCYSGCTILVVANCNIVVVVNYSDYSGWMILVVLFG